MKIKFRIFLCFLIFTTLFVISSFAQNTDIKGKVYDSQTREPLPFVNVKYKGGKLYTTTDLEGNFSLVTPFPPSDSMEVSYIGYLVKNLKIKKGVTQVINIYLETDQQVLGEVTILPGENPAHRILKKVIARKDANNKDKLNAYEYEVYNKIEFDMNNIPPAVKNNKLIKPLKFVFDYIDSTSVTEKPYLPLLISESLSNFFWRRTPKVEKEIIKANKMSGLKDNSASQFMGEMYQKVNIYDNNILIFGKQFPSPISDHALSYYKFYLIDSMLIGNTRCYQLRFQPRRKQEYSFIGNVFISDTTYAVKRLEMSIPDDVNLNFVKSLNVIQEYEPSVDSSRKDSAWMLSRDKLVVDFKYDEFRKKPKNIGFYARKTTSYKNIVINNPRPLDFFNKTDNIVVEDSAILRSDAYWASFRHDTLSKNEKLIYHIVDTVRSLPIYKSWFQWIYILTVGYKQFGKIELGPYFKTYSFNTVEGNRFRLGARTTNSFSTWKEINGYVAYGTRDDRFKFAGEFKTFITKKPRQIASFNYKNDLEVLGRSSNSFSSDNVLTTALRRTPLSKLTLVQQYGATYELEPWTGFNMQFSLLNRIMSPKGTLRYDYIASMKDTLSLNTIISSEVKTKFRFAYHEKYVEYAFNRVSTGTHYPIVTLFYTYGMKNVLRSNYEYHKFALNINDRIRIVPLLGYTDYIVEAGKVFGTIPYPLLELHGGNETVIYDNNAFNMMNYYEFGSDQYLTVQAFHHFDGFFLNHIPLMRRLKWREVVTAKALLGDIANHNRNVLIFPGTLSSLNGKPYYEVSAGVENIFKIFRIDALWRLSYIDKKYEQFYAAKGGSTIPKFNIMLSLQVTF